MPRRTGWEDYIPASGQGRALIEVKGKIGKGAGRSRGRMINKPYPGWDRGDDTPRIQGGRMYRRRFRMSRSKGFWDAISFNQNAPGNTHLREPNDMFTWVGGHLPILFIYPKVLPPAALTTQEAVNAMRPGHETKMQLLQLQGRIMLRMTMSQVDGEETAPSRHPFILYEWAKIRVSGPTAETRYLNSQGSDNTTANIAALEGDWLDDRRSDKAAQPTNAIAAIPGQVSGGIPGHRTRDDVMMRGIVVPSTSSEYSDFNNGLTIPNSQFHSIPYPRRPKTVLDAESSCLVLSVQLFESGTNQPVAVGRGDAARRYMFEFRTETFRGRWLPA